MECFSYEYLDVTCYIVTMATKIINCNTNTNKEYMCN